MPTFFRHATAFAAAASAAASCLSSVKPDGGQEEIVFHPVAEAEVRAGNADVFSNDISFGVWALTSDGRIHIDREKVSRDGETWTAETPYYWPEEGDLEFYAFAPYGDGVELGGDGSLILEDYTLETASDGLYVCEPGAGQTRTDNHVYLTFHQAASKIDFRVANGLNQVTSVKLEKIILCGVFVRGSYRSCGEPQWNVTGEAADITVYDSSASGVSDDVDRDPEYFGKTIAVIPQQSFPTVKVVYSFVNGDSEWLYGQENSTEELEARWEPGRHYTYTLTLTETTVKYSAGISSSTE